MATTDYEVVAHRPLAILAYNLHIHYKIETVSQDMWLRMYDKGEIQLSTVYENLFCHIRTLLGKPTHKVSENHRDFSNDGDFKIGILKKDGMYRRFVISNVANKIGTIYFVGWNWLNNTPAYYAIPRLENFPACGIKILVDSDTGEYKSVGKYNLHRYPTFEEMVFVD